MAGDATVVRGDHTPFIDQINPTSEIPPPPGRLPGLLREQGAQEETGFGPGKPAMEAKTQPSPGSGGKLSFKGTANILQARDMIEQESGMESMAAFHRWRMASLKTQYARQLRGILSDVHQDELRLKEAQVP